jgi:type I restriction enzyme, S subunit
MNWPTCSLDKLLILSDAGTWGEEGSEKRGFPVLRSTNIQDSKLTLDDFAWRIIPKAHMAKKKLADGDIIVTTSSGSPNHIGKCCLFRDEGKDKDYYFSNFTLRLRVNPKELEPSWLHYWLSSSQGRTVLDAMNNTTSGLRNLDKCRYLSQKVPLPPLNEQRRIATILNKADAVRRKRQQAIALAKDLLRSAFLEMFGDPVINPKGWNTTTLGEVLTDIESGWSPKCDPRKANQDEWGVLKLGAVTYGDYNEAEHKTLLPGDVPRPQIEVKQGDLLFSRKNTYELVGASAYVYQTRPGLMLPDLIFRLCCKAEADSIYIWQALSQKTVRSQLTGLASGSSGSMPNISKSRLKTLTIPIPPLPLQQKYRSVAHSLWINQQRQEKNCELTEDLFNSLLQRAFRGDL